MDEKEQDNVAAFDMLFTTNQIQIMKALLPCLDRPMQKYLAIYIKYQELQYTISYFKKHPHYICGAASGQKTDIRSVLPSILPYCNDSQKQKIQQMEQMMSSLETYKEMMDMMEMMQAMTNTAAPDERDSGENTAQESGSGMQMPDMEALLSMLSPEQQTMIELLKGGMNNE